MATYNVELTRESIDGHLEYKKKFNMKGDIGSSGGGALVVNVTTVDEEMICDKTAGEMWAACQTGVVIFRLEPYEGHVMVELLTNAYLDSESGYSFDSYTVSVSADTENDYPSGGGIT